MASAAKKPRFLKKALAALAISAASAALVAALWLPGALDGLEGVSFNLRAQALARPEKASDDVVLVFLDQPSLDWALEQMDCKWPWPRELYSLIVEFCASGGAKAVAMDVVFTEPSTYGVEDDLLLADSIKKAGNVVSSVSFLEKAETGSPAWPEGLPWRPAPLSGMDSWLSEKGRSVVRGSAAFNIPEYDSACSSIGNVIFQKDSDSIYRRITPLCSFDGTAVPALGLAAYMAGAGSAGLEYRSGDLFVGGRRVPLDGKGTALLDYRGPSMTHTVYNAAEIIQSAIQLRNCEPPKYDSSVMKGKYVFFGFTATGLYDLRPTPMKGNYPGVEIHATFLDNLLSGSFLRDMPKPAALLSLLALSLLASAAMVSLRKTAAQGVCFAAFLVLPVGLGFGLYVLGLWFPMVPAVLALFLSLSASALYNYSTEGRQKAFIKSAFRQYLSPIVIEQLIANPEKLNLGGERRMLSIYFSDVQGFTSLSEALSPEELTSVLNEYLSAMTDIIQDEGGTVDKYEGDAIIAFWNAPLDLSDHGIRAVRASLRCQEKLAEMRPALKARTGKELFMRIGLNSGPAVVGNMGSKTRFDYTMLGDAVNLAARLEGVNKQFGTYTMISENTLKEIKDAFAVRELSKIAVVGKSIPVRVYEPMSHEAYAKRKELFVAFAEALALYYAGDFPSARKAFSALSESDPPSMKYLAQCDRLIDATPSEWKGVWTMTEK